MKAHCCFLLFIISAVSINAAQAPHGGPVSTSPAPRLQSYRWMSLADWYRFHSEDIEIAEKAEARILFIGDSITEGWAYNGGEFWKEHFEPLGAVNFGIGGDMTQNLVWRLRHGAVGSMQPESVIVLIGTNNFGFYDNEAPVHVASGVAAVLEELRANFETAEVLLMAVFPRGEHAEDPQRARIAELNRIISGFDAWDRVTYLNINDQFLEENGQLPAEIMPDFLHLSAQGYEIWGKAILEWLQR